MNTPYTIRTVVQQEKIAQRYITLEDLAKAVTEVETRLWDKKQEYLRYILNVDSTWSEATAEKYLEEIDAIQLELQGAKQNYYSTL